MTVESLWPTAQSPDDLPAVEEMPLASRGLPTSTYDVVLRAARLWPDRTAVTVLPNGTDYQRFASRTFGNSLPT